MSLDDANYTGNLKNHGGMQKLDGILAGCRSSAVDQNWRGRKRRRVKARKCLWDRKTEFVEECMECRDETIWYSRGESQW